MTFVTIPGRPVPYTRVRSGQGRMYLPERYRNYRALASDVLGFSLPRFEDATIAVKVIVGSEDVQVAVERSENVRPKHIRGDVDNYLKAVLDALEDSGRTANDRNVVSAEVMFEHLDR